MKYGSEADFLINTVCVFGGFEFGCLLEKLKIFKECSFRRILLFFHSENIINLNCWGILRTNESKALISA
jgi:hypothetical protein